MTIKLRVFLYHLKKRNIKFLMSETTLTAPQKFARCPENNGCFLCGTEDPILEEDDLFKPTVKACTVRHLCLFMQIQIIYAPQVSAGSFLIGQFKQ